MDVQAQVAICHQGVRKDKHRADWHRVERMKSDTKLVLRALVLVSRHSSRRVIIDHVSEGASTVQL